MSSDRDRRITTLGSAAVILEVPPCDAATALADAALVKAALEAMEYGD